jgi:hypothetical protein
MMGAVRVLGRIGVSMVHSVQNGIRSGREVRTTLPNPSKEIEKLFPVFAHDKHLVSSIPMKEETLAKQGEIPVKQEEDYDNHSGNN